MCGSGFEPASSGTVLGEDPGAVRFADGALIREVAGIIAAAQGTSLSVFPRVLPAVLCLTHRVGQWMKDVLCAGRGVTDESCCVTSLGSGSNFRGSQFGQMFVLSSELPSVATGGSHPPTCQCSWLSEVLGSGTTLNIRFSVEFPGVFALRSNETCSHSCPLPSPAASVCDL